LIIMQPPAIELEHVQFSWSGGPPVLSIPSFHVAKGERVFLKGASGSGKSTLLGLIGGVLTHDAGDVRILGQPLQELSAIRRDAFRASHIGYIFQMFNLLPFLSTVENVQLTTRFSRERASRVGGDPRGEAKRLLAALGLRDPALLERPITALSIGQQQRVAAARALMGRPELVIADEPTSALDTDSRFDFLELLQSECEAAGSSLLFVSHDTGLAGAFDRTVAMGDINVARPLS
jgi:putative ABC transport system ATP-binding protein